MKPIIVEADNLQEAEKELLKKIPEGFTILNKKILCDGKPVQYVGTADTEEEAFANANRQISNDATIIEKKLVTDAKDISVTVQANNEREAELSALSGLSGAQLKAIRLIDKGRRGFLGIGSKPKIFEVEIRQSAVVHVTVKQNAKIEASIQPKPKQCDGCGKLTDELNDINVGKTTAKVCRNCWENIAFRGQVPSRIKSLMSTGGEQSNNKQSDIQIDFISRPTVDAMIEFLRDELKSINADKVLVVGGFEKLNSLTSDEFPKYEFLYNSYDYFGWLLKICEYARETKNPQIIVSKFIRHWNPPKMKIVQASFDPNLFAPADGKIGGNVFEVEASIVAQFMKYPNKKITLNVIDEKDNTSTIAIYFFGSKASSYYREVLASQGCPPRKPIVCKVISGPDDPALETPEINRLLATDNPQEQSTILKEVSENLEKFCTSSNEKREMQEYTGGIMLPKFPQNEQLPPGARSEKTEGETMKKKWKE